MATFREDEPKNLKQNKQYQIRVGKQTSYVINDSDYYQMYLHSEEVFGVTDKITGQFVFTHSIQYQTDIYLQQSRRHNEVLT